MGDYRPQAESRTLTGSGVLYNIDFFKAETKLHKSHGRILEWAENKDKHKEENEYLTIQR